MDFFTKNVRYLRNKKGLKQTELADLLGVTRATIANYENGNSKPDFKTLEMLLDYFEVNPTELLSTEIETSSVSSTLSKALGTDIRVVADKKQSALSQEEQELISWGRTSSLFNANYEMGNLYRTGEQLKYSLSEASKQYIRVFKKNIDIITAKYGDKSPFNRDNTAFFNDNKKHVEALEKFIEIYSDVLNELNKAVVEAREKFKLD